MGFGSFMEVLSVFLAPSDASHKTVSAIYQQNSDASKDSLKLFPKLTAHKLSKNV